MNKSTYWHLPCQRQPVTCSLLARLAVRSGLGTLDGRHRPLIQWTTRTARTISTAFTVTSSRSQLVQSTTIAIIKWVHLYYKAPWKLQSRSAAVVSNTGVYPATGEVQQVEFSRITFERQAIPDVHFSNSEWWSARACISSWNLAHSNTEWLKSLSASGSVSWQSRWYYTDRSFSAV